MRILVTGSLPQSIWTVVQRMVRGGHQVVVLGKADRPKRLPAGIKHYQLSPENPDALQKIDASRLETIVFFLAWQCEAAPMNVGAQVMLDALIAVLEQGVRSNASRFVLITDQRVFGANQAGRENDPPTPDTSAGILIKAAEDCLSCYASDKMETKIVRVTSLYDETARDSLFSLAAECALYNTPLSLAGTKDTPCDFLHADDLGTYLNLSIGTGVPPITHLYYGKSYTYADLEEKLRSIHPGLAVSYSGTSRVTSLQGNGSRVVDWVPRHDFSLELGNLVYAPNAEKPREKKRPFSPRTRKIMRLATAVVELIVFGILAAFLEDVSENNTILGVVDYLVLYVAIIGNVYGRRFGQIAALLACIHYVFDWAVDGNDLHLLLYNADHWLPLSTYLLFGSLFGYLHDKAQTQISTLEREHNDLQAQNKFLNELYHQVYEDRNQLQEQVMHTRDSFGRIYQITRELDALLPQQVFSSALDVLENIMQCHTVSIYECRNDTPFARLVVRSRALKQLPRSLDLMKFDAMTEQLRAGKVFVNKSLSADYPTYAVSVNHDGALVAILVLWDIPFDKQSQYYENLFSVVAGLVQGSLGRAFRYFTLAGDVYLENTHILSDNAFRSALSVYQNIRKRRTGQFLLVRVGNVVDLEPTKVDACISQVIRSTDLVGRLSDGEYYVLFPQANSDDLKQINARLSAQKMECDLVIEEIADV